jgi:Fur family peroxide stress response transcriptional regulator
MEGRVRAAERLRERGLRVTQQRVAVLTYLASVRHHPTAEEVGLAVNRHVPTARASVYNVLRSLREAGLIEELVFDDAVVRYDANLEKHHHFVCAACGGVADVPWDSLPQAPKRKLADGRTVEEWSVMLHGRCPGCQ